MLEQGECGGGGGGSCRRFHWRGCTGFHLVKSFFAGKRSDSKQTLMQSTHMQAHTDSNKANNETSTAQHADRCMQTLHIGAPSSI